MNRKLLTLILFIIISKFSLAQSLDMIVNPILYAKNISYVDYIVEKDIFSNKRFLDTVLAKFDYSKEDSLIKIVEAKRVTWKDGNKLVVIDYNDSTYRIKKINDFSSAINNSFVLTLKSLLDRLNKDNDLLSLQDTIIPGKPSLYYKYVLVDSIKNYKRIYESFILCADKETLIPNYLRVDSEGFINNSEIHIVHYQEHKPSNLKINIVDFPNISNIVIRENITPYIPKKTLPLLAKKSLAPPLTFENKSRNHLSLDNLKGKVILLNISWVGCPYCIQSIKMLNDLNDKYSGSDFQIISLYPLDNYDDVQKMINEFDVKYQFYQVNNSTKNDLKNYNIDGYPTFYLIDKNRKIVDGWAGYSKEIAVQIERELIKSLKQ